MHSNNSKVLTLANNVLHSYQKLHLYASWFVYQRTTETVIMLGWEDLHSSTVVGINLSCVKPP